LTWRELAGRADDAPDDACGSENLGRGADEAVLLIRAAHVGDIGEHPSLDSKLDGPGNNACDDLSKEHGSRRNLHVVTQLEVGGEC